MTEGEMQKYGKAARALQEKASQIKVFFLRRGEGLLEFSANTIS